MEKSYEAPELELIGAADEVVLGSALTGLDGDGTIGAMDFEFEQD